MISSQSNSRIGHFGYEHDQVSTMRMRQVWHMPLLGGVTTSDCIQKNIFLLTQTTCGDCECTITMVYDMQTQLYLFFDFVWWGLFHPNGNPLWPNPGTIWIYVYIYIYMYIYIYTLGALGFRRAGWFLMIHLCKITVSP